MRKILLILLIVACGAAGWPSSFKLEAAVSQLTVNYLAAGAQSAWVTQALKAAGRDNLDLAYLNDWQGQHANDFAKTILAVVAAGQNPASFNGQNLTERLLGYQNNNQLGSTNLLNDDFWGILALRSAGLLADQAAIQNSKNFVLANQNRDGGWGFDPGGSSDTNDTAAAIMALVEAGVGAGDAVIVRALDYLRGLQNDDGGFGFVEGESDAGSDAWVIAALNKLNINPTAWQINNHNPIGHLESLSLNDGSFRWLAGDQAGNRLMTAYAAVALAGASYPVARFNPPNNENEEEQDNEPKHLRLEGAGQTLCDIDLQAMTALEAITRGAAVCGYQYNIEQTDFGPYLTSINNETAEGENGWLYRVNWLSPNVGAADYRLQAGNYVLWAFGHYTAKPLRLTLAAPIVEVNAEVLATVEYFNEQEWLASTNTRVIVGERVFTTNDRGQAALSFDTRALYNVYAEKAGFIRSQKEGLRVGLEQGESVSLAVNIENNNQGGNNGDNQGRLAFTVETDNLDFGALRPGAAANRSIRIINSGEVGIYLESAVSGDQVFVSGLSLNQQSWENFSASYNARSGGEISVSLTVPPAYQSAGPKQGQLIFWAIAR